LSALPLALLFGFSLPCDQKDRRARNALVIATVFAFGGAISSGKFYAYYMYPVVVPLTALFVLSNFARKWLVMLVAMTILMVASAVIYIKNFGTLEEARATYDFSQYRKLHDLVGKDDMLSMRAHMEVTYFSDIKPMQPYVWENHAELIMGAGEDDYFSRYLAAKPKFVATNTYLCQGDKAEWDLPKSCATLTENYTRIMNIEDHAYFRRAYIYQRNAS